MKKGRTKAKNEERTGYIFVLPALIYMIVLVGYPIIYNIILSFQDAGIKNIRGGKQFIGLQNYLTILGTENMQWALKNTFRFTLISIAFQLLFGLALALFFNRKFPLAKTIRGMMIVSYLLPNVVSALLFKYMLSPDAGIIDKILTGTGILKAPVGWLQNIDTALWGPIFANIWTQTPFIMLLLTTGLGSISDEVLESSALDGANHRQQFFYIILPLLKNSMMAVLMLGFMYTFKVFDLIYTMTGGGPVYATEVLSTYAYKLSFSSYKFGQGAAAANILFFCLLIVSLFYRYMIGKEE